MVYSQPFRLYSQGFARAFLLDKTQVTTIFADHSNSDTSLLNTIYSSIVWEELLTPPPPR